MGKKIGYRARRKQYQEKYQRGFPNNWFKFCREPIENIDGWSEMLNDTSGQRWNLHHRDEISEDGEVVSSDELKDRGEYYHLAADRLIFLTESVHMSLHHMGARNPMYEKTGENNPMYGKTGEKNPNYGRNKYDITEEALRELYVVQRLSLRKIAKKFGCHHKRIIYYLKKFGISRK